jgi:hypothetical protein
MHFQGKGFIAVAALLRRLGMSVDQQNDRVLRIVVIGQPHLDKQTSFKSFDWKDCHVIETEIATVWFPLFRFLLDRRLAAPDTANQLTLDAFGSQSSQFAIRANAFGTLAIPLDAPAEALKHGLLDQSEFLGIVHE